MTGKPSVRGASRRWSSGPDHPDVATSLNNLAFLYLTQGRYEAALDHIRRATTIYRARVEQAGATRSVGALKEQILDLPQRQGETDIHHQRKADNLG